MIDDFIKKTIHMLSKSDIRIHMTSFDRVELDGEKRTVFIELTDSFWHTKLEDNLILCQRNISNLYLNDIFIMIINADVGGGID